LLLLLAVDLPMGAPDLGPQKNADKFTDTFAKISNVLFIGFIHVTLPVKQKLHEPISVNHDSLANHKSLILATSS
jgi:hypothetical protein